MHLFYQRSKLDFRVTHSVVNLMWIIMKNSNNLFRGCRGRDRMVVGFATTYATSDVVSSNLEQHYVVCSGYSGFLQQ